MAIPPVTTSQISQSPSERARAESAVRRFASVFLEQMLSASMPKMFGNVPGAGSFQDLYLNALSRQLASEGNGMGIVSMLDRALHLPDTQQPVVQLAPPVPEDAENTPIPGGAQSFVRKILPYAQEVGEALGIAPRLIVAQAALETGWGRHIIGNNLFGIKALHGQNGIDAETEEFLGGTYQQIVQDFRAFPDVLHCMQNYGQLLEQHYPAVVGVGDDAARFADALQSGGYATAPNYAAKLTQIANSPELLAILGEQ